MLAIQREEEKKIERDRNNQTNRNSEGVIDIQIEKGRKSKKEKRGERYLTCVCEFINLCVCV